MILDSALQFTGFPATGGIVVTGTNYDLPTTGSQNSSNVIDLHMLGIPVLVSGQGARDIGIGDNPAMKLLIQVTATMAGAGAALTIALQGSPDNGSGAPLGFTSWWTSPAYGVAGLTAGTRLYDMDMPRPPAGLPVPRFLRLSYSTAGGTFTSGAIGAWIVLDRFDQMYNASNNAVLGGYPPGIVIAN